MELAGGRHSGRKRLLRLASLLLGGSSVTHRPWLGRQANCVSLHPLCRSAPVSSRLRLPLFRLPLFFSDRLPLFFTLKSGQNLSRSGQKKKVIHQNLRQWSATHGLSSRLLGQGRGPVACWDRAGAAGREQLAAMKLSPEE